ncbi:MAG: ATP-binding protein, partial [Acidobacteriota bacterium]
MKFGAIENRTRLAIAFFAIAMLLTIALSLALFQQSRRELADQQLNQVRLEAAMIASLLANNSSSINEPFLRAMLERNSIAASIAVYSTDKRLIARASTVDDNALESQRLSAGLLAYDNQVAASKDISIDEVQIKTESGFIIARLHVPGLGLVVMARPMFAASSAMVFYVLSYQIVALFFGLAIVFLVARWMLRPFRRLVKAAHDSPVHPSSAKSESEFVVETFQALIDQLKEKEKELEQLHTMERNRAERSERFSERLIANIPTGLVSVNARGAITSVNARATEILGLSHSDTGPLAAASVRQSMGGDYRAVFQSAPKMVQLISQCLSERVSFRREVVDITYPDGRMRYLGLSISPISDVNSNLEGALCLMTDLTEVIELRERMKLQENLANLGEMAAGLAHEFKNSLATIQGYMQLFDAHSLLSPGDRQASIEATLNEVRLLARLVTDFLNFARPQNLNLSTVDARSIIEDCLAEIEPLLKEAGIEVRIEGEFNEIPGDESLLRRAFGNLLRNAVEAIDPQSGRKLIAISGFLDAGGERRHAHIRIRDTGSGIAVEDLQRIFIPFFTTKSRGYGIGLALVQKIIVAHGGTVAVE